MARSKPFVVTICDDPVFEQFFSEEDKCTEVITVQFEIRVVMGASKLK